MSVDENQGNVNFFKKISDWFWEIIESSDGKRDKMSLILEKMTKEEIYRFANEFQKASSLLWADDYVKHMGDVSEDGMLDICEWIVSQGKTYYLDILKNPHKTPKEDDIGRSRLYGVAHTIYWKRFKERLRVPLGGNWIE